MNKRLASLGCLALLPVLLLPGCGSAPEKPPASEYRGSVGSLIEADAALGGPRAADAIAWLEQNAANAGSPHHEKSLLRLAQAYSSGTGVEKNENMAARHYYSAAKLGNTDAQAEMAHRYHHGLGVEPNPTLSVHWARKAAESGNAEGQLFLGWSYENGIGLQQNYMRAARLYENAAAQGNGPAMYHLGTLHHRGRVYATNNERAITLYQQSAEKGYGPAHLALGFIYLVGDGVRKDPRQALEQFLKASDREVAEGAFQAARLMEGRGEREVARELYRRAYRLGKISAMQDVRRMDGRTLQGEIYSSESATGFDPDSPPP